MVGSPNPELPFYERGLFWGLLSLAAAVVLTAAGFLLPPTTFAKWLLMFAWFLLVVPIWLASDAISAYKAITWFSTLLLLALTALGINMLWDMRVVSTIAVDGPAPLWQFIPAPPPQSGYKKAPTPQGTLTPDVSFPAQTPSVTSGPKPKDTTPTKPAPPDAHPIIIVTTTTIDYKTDTHVLSYGVNIANTGAAEANVHIVMNVFWNGNSVSGSATTKDVAIAPAPYSFTLSGTETLSAAADLEYINKTGIFTVTVIASYRDKGGTTTYTFKGKAIPNLDHFDISSSGWEYSAPN